MRSLVRVSGLLLSFLVLVPACTPVGKRVTAREPVRPEHPLDVGPLEALGEVR